MIRRIGLVALLLLTVTTGLPAQESTAELAKRLGRFTRTLEGARRVLVGLRSSGVVDFLMTPIADDRQLPIRDPLNMRVRDPFNMRRTASFFRIDYEDAWDRNPEAFWERLVTFSENMARDLTAQLEARRNAERPVAPADGPLPVPRDAKGQPIVTDSLVSRFLKAKSSSWHSEYAPWRSGNFLKLDYEDVAKRIEWARASKFQQGGEVMVSTPAMRDQFSDEEVNVLNRRWRDLDAALTGRFDEVRW